MSRSSDCRSDTPADLEERWRTIEGKILAAAGLLERGGALSQKDDRGAPVWRLRYRERLATGQVVMRAIWLGRNVEVVRRARILLERCRQKGGWRKEIAALCDLSATAAAVVGRAVRSEGRSARYRRNLGRGH
jgi:hypothetical protein